MNDGLICKFQKQEILLKDPYETDCENYEEIWKKNNHTGPRIQEVRPKVL